MTSMESGCTTTRRPEGLWEEDVSPRLLCRFGCGLPGQTQLPMGTQAQGAAVVCRRAGAAAEKDDDGMLVLRERRMQVRGALHALPEGEGDEDFEAGLRL